MAGCRRGNPGTVVEEDTYTNPIFNYHSNTHVYKFGNIYYHCQDINGRIVLRRTNDITNLDNAESKVLLNLAGEHNLHHLWAPQITRLQDKWYIYFSGDDGNTDNHQIYVLENSASDPFHGEFVLKGRISTDPENNWAIHAYVFEHHGKIYMTWSGWESKRLYQETQCIYIAEMKDPYTLATPRVLISKPEYEWERQWVNPDGSKFGYPVYVNEYPFLFQWDKSGDIYLYYSASAVWTKYHCVGRLSASKNSNLLDPRSWTKAPKPVFTRSEKDSVYGPGDINIIASPDSTEYYMLYIARPRPNDPFGMPDSKKVRMQKIGANEDGSPNLGKPVPLSVKMKKPSGTPKIRE